MSPGARSSQESSGDDSDASDASQSSFQMPDPLALGREKRATAGNRLRDMLNLELESEVIFEEDAEDADFGSDQDQVHDHNSELDSSSEDDAAAQEPDDAGEQALKSQEKAAARQKKRRAADAFAKPKPKLKSRPEEKQGAAGGIVSKPTKKRERVSIGLAAQRQSDRAHTRKVAGAVERRLQAAQKKQGKQVVVPRTIDQPLTQAERLEEAKLTEAKNVASLNQVVKYEEEKKATQRALAAKRQAAQPTIRIISSARTAASQKSAAEPKIVEMQADELSLAHPMDALAGATTSTASTKETLTSTDFSDATTQAVEAPHISTKQFIAFANFEQHPSARELLLGLPAGTKRKRPPGKVTCPITGLPARYKDPKTRVCVADLAAYQTVKQIAAGQVPYNPTLNMYTGPAYVPTASSTSR